jgi:hypothetical protein
MTEFTTDPIENPPGYGELSEADVCAGSTRNDPHLWDQSRSCRVCERRRA